MKLRYHRNTRTRTVEGLSYPIRPRSFVASIGAHCCVIGLVAMVPVSRVAPLRPIYTELIQPQADKIVWRIFREPVPDVSAAKKVGRSNEPRGVELSERVVVATERKAESQNQVIWRPAPKIEIRQDLPLPNLVSRVNLPAPLPPEEPKSFPTEPQPKPPQPSKTFIPPPKTSTPIPPPAQILIPDAPVPSMTVSVPSTTVLATSKGLSLPPPPPAPVPSPGNATADLVVASIHPAENTVPLPDGARPGRFSEAPVKGRAATGEVSGITVPNLTLRDPNPTGPDVNRSDLANREESRKITDLKAANLTPRTILYAEKLRNVPVSTLSAPLRPASRTIPREIDARFQGRYVYAMVMPIENLPMYGGDWILWFAERNQRPGDTPSMRAPILFRKTESVQAVDLPAQTQQRFQLTGTITKEGRIEGISLLTKAGSAIEQTLIRDLASWEFKPASRDGSPVDVEVVIEIPFNFSQIAERARH